MDYKIIDRIAERESDSGRFLPRGSKWQDLFKPLPVNKAIELKCSTRLEASKMLISLHGSFRRSRHAGFTIRGRVIPDGKEFILYCWKVEDGN